MRVLVVEDDPKLAGLLRRSLREHGNAADVAREGEEALWMARAHPYDAIVLDVMLPGIDGFATCAALREADVWAPVLMLTARDAVEDRICGLDAAPTTTWSSRSHSPTWWRGCARSCGAARARGRA